MSPADDRQCAVDELCAICHYDNIGLYTTVKTDLPFVSAFRFSVVNDWRKRRHGFWRDYVPKAGFVAPGPEGG